MKELLKKLDKLAEKYHKKQMRINNRADPEFYLYMGKSNGIGEAIDMIKETIAKLPIAKISDDASIETIDALEKMFELASKNYVFSKKDFFEMAKIIDSNFIGSEETFTAERKNGYYYLTTNKCDDCSCIRVFCEPKSINIDNIDRIANDTDGYERIHKETALKVKKYVQSLVC